VQIGRQWSEEFVSLVVIGATYASALAAGGNLTGRRTSATLEEFRHPHRQTLTGAAMEHLQRPGLSFFEVRTGAAKAQRGRDQDERISQIPYQAQRYHAGEVFPTPAGQEAKEKAEGAATAAGIPAHLTPVLAATRCNPAAWRSRASCSSWLAAPRSCQSDWVCFCKGTIGLMILQYQHTTSRSTRKTGPTKGVNTSISGRSSIRDPSICTIQADASMVSPTIRVGVPIPSLVHPTVSQPKSVVRRSAP
jgi:hypothetical protein